MVYAHPRGILNWAKYHFNEPRLIHHIISAKRMCYKGIFACNTDFIFQLSFDIWARIYKELVRFFLCDWFFIIDYKLFNFPRKRAIMLKQVITLSAFGAQSFLDQMALCALFLMGLTELIRPKRFRACGDHFPAKKKLHRAIRGLHAPVFKFQESLLRARDPAPNY